MRPYFFTCLVLLIAATAARAADEYLWWEAESPTTTNFNRQGFPPDSYGKNRSLISGGNWLAHRGPVPDEGLFAKYEIKIPKTAAYNLWTRKYWKHGAFEWRVGAQSWRACGRDCGLVDNTTLSTHIGLNWVYLGEVKLPAGTQVLEVRLAAPPGGTGTGCFDCFLLTPSAFRPRGYLKPDAPAPAAPDGWWAYDAAPEHPFPRQEEGDAAPGAARLLDLRALNEAQAGAAGYVRAEGDRLLRGDGQAIRFWGVNAAANILELENPQVEDLVDRLAWAGVNLVRIRTMVYDPKAKDPTAILSRRLERIHNLVAALRKRGIYASLTFFSPAWFNIKDHYAIPGYTRRPKFDRKPEGLLFIDPRLQDFHRAWARALLSSPNPYGPPLGKDPAVAMVEIVHDDDLFAWTFNARTIPPEQLRKLEDAFGAWLRTKYGNEEKAAQAWGADARNGRDDLATDPPRLGLWDIWHLTRKGRAASGPGKHKRLQDQAQFMTEHLRAFYRQTADYLKKDLGYGGLITTGHVDLSGEAALRRCADYAAAPLDAVVRNGWFTPPHRGLRKEFAIATGDVFADVSLLRRPLEIPPALSGRVPAGLPRLVNELNWQGPSRLRAEAPLLAAAIAALQGVDTVGWFALNGPYTTTTAEKFPLSTAGMLGQCPAAALLYRRGDVAEAPVLGQAALSESNLWSLSDPKFIHDEELLAAAAGRTLMKAGKESPDRPLDLTPHYDAGKKTLRSANGELIWDFGRGVLRIDTPKSQAAAGYLKAAGGVDLGEVRIEMKNEYACVHLVSLDGAPLAASKRMLLQCFTREEPAGFETSHAEAPRNTDGTLPDPAVAPAYHRVDQVGHFPLLIQRAQGRVVFRHPPVRATVLDEGGRARGPAILDGARLTVPPDALYVLIER